MGAPLTSWTNCAWNVAAADALRTALGDDELPIRADVEQGRAELWRIEGDCDGWLITRIELTDNNREMVLIACAGRGIAAAVEVLKGVCRAQRIPSLRFHSTRPGAARFVAPMGFVEIERVYRCEVH